MKATHSGHCQLCGALQKLPNDRLSLHGYNVEHGFFSGVCRGAKALPFELSMHLVLDEIERALDACARVEDAIAHLRSDVDERTMMWHHTFVPSKNGTRSRYVWEQVALRAEMVTNPVDGWQRVEYAYTDCTGRTGGGLSSGFYGVFRHEMPKETTLEALRQATVLKYNNVYATWRMHEVTSLKRYVAWQRDRIKNWAPAPLLTRDGGRVKDTSAFKPTEAAY